MTYLRHGVPLTLLADLLADTGPRSREIYATEAASDDVDRDAATLTGQQPIRSVGEAAGGGGFTAGGAAC
jgi:hypothetical protein